MNMLVVHRYSEAESNIEKHCSDYDDLYKFYHFQESQISINSKMHKEENLNMRKNVIDWLIQKHYKQKLKPETLYLCVNIIDRFLSKIDYEVATEEEFKLIGITSLFLASKYEQSDAVDVYNMESLAEYCYLPEDICETEKVILQKLNWFLSVPTPYVFLIRNIRACGEDKMMENMVFFFSELSLTHYPIVCGYKPSIIAASAVFCARTILGRYPFWSNDLKMCVGYSEEKLMPCVKVMMELCNQICSDGHMEVFKKFSSLYQCRVSCVAQENLEQCFLSY